MSLRTHLAGRDAALDGIRAVAIVAVLAYHAGLVSATGGFLGVDVFFTLSGYLITRILLRQAASSTGIRLGGFYQRRFFRLYPALLVMLVVTTIAAGIFTPDAGPVTLRDLPAATVSSMNWWLVFHQQNYFDGFGRPELFQHTWSLAVEWQFYIVWPILLALAYRRGKRRGVGLITAVLIVGALGRIIGLALSHDFSQPSIQSEFYFGSDTRILGLLIGALLATILFRPLESVSDGEHFVRSHAAFVGIASLVLTLTLISSDDPTLYKIGFILATCTTALIIWGVAIPDTVIGGLLSIKPLTWLGTRSYSVYLWHWPIFQLLRPGIDVPLNPVTGTILRLSLTFAIAAVSYRWIEQPGRSLTAKSLLKRIDDTSPLRIAGIAFASAFAIVVGGSSLYTKIAGDDARSEAERIAMFQAPKLASPTKSQPPQKLAATLRRPAPLKSAARTTWVPNAHGITHVLIARPKDSDSGQTRLPSSVSRSHIASPAPVLLAQLKLPKPIFATSGSRVAVTTVEKLVKHSVVSGRFVFASSPIAHTYRDSAHRPLLYQLEDATLLGDSIMLAASRAIASRFRVVNIDAVVGRQADILADVVLRLRDSGHLTPVVILDIGNNGTFTPETLHTILSALATCDRVVVVNAHVPRVWQDDANEKVARIVGSYPNTVIADWHSAADGHPEYFGEDGVHPGPVGASAYTQTIVEALARTIAVTSPQHERTSIVAARGESSL